MRKKVKLRVLIWDCERCGVHNESPINICSYCQFIRVRECMVSLKGRKPKLGKVTCMKCKKELPGNHDLRKIGGRPAPLQTLYQGTLNRIAKELGEMVPGVLEVVRDLQPYVGMQLCYSCHPAEGGVLSKVVVEDTPEETIDRQIMVKQVKEKLEAKMASDPSIEPDGAWQVARSIIRRMDEDMAYDAEDRRVRHMIREARPVKFSLMKKNLSGDDLLSARQDITHRLEQLAWRYRSARNQMAKANAEVDSLEAEEKKTYGRMKLFEGLTLSEDPEKRIDAKVKLASARKRHSFLERKIEDVWGWVALQRDRARRAISLTRKYRSLLFELKHIYEIRWSTLLNREGSNLKGFGYEIRQDAFGVEEVNTPTIGLERCARCRMPSDKVKPFPVRYEQEEDGKKVVRTMDTIFLCEPCFTAERKGKPRRLPSKAKKEVARKRVDAEQMARNLDKDWSDYLKRTSANGCLKVADEIAPKCQRTFTVENIDYKTHTMDLWVIAVPKPGERLPEKMAPEGKAFVRILSILPGDFQSAYLWCSLGEEGRKEWVKEAESMGMKFSHKGLLERFLPTRDPWVIADKLGKSLPVRHFEGEGEKKFWRCYYELGNYLSIPWKARALILREGDPQYMEVYEYQRGRMDEIHSFGKEEKEHEDLWHSYWTAIADGPKPMELLGKPYDKMFAMAGEPCKEERYPRQSEEYFKEIDRKEELRKVLMAKESEFNKLASDVLNFVSYMKMNGDGRDFEVVAAEWMVVRRAEKERQKANKGNAQPK